ncbi:MAG TPA: Na+/H+ antiporter subunit E [Fusibacter sp.]|nr:Na+/H+ antiporter subunit E [Fusibacter sp.]
MNRIVYYAQLTLMMSLFWIILFEATSAVILISAPFIAVFSILLSEKYLLKESYYNLYPFNVLRLIRFTFFLFFEIFKSGLSIIPSIITGKSNPTFVEIGTELDRNMDLIILSNSITLTPGTITVDLEGQRLIVLWMNPLSDNSTKAGELIKGKLEKIIKEGL